jgi:hypothetical protein
MSMIVDKVFGSNLSNEDGLLFNYFVFVIGWLLIFPSIRANFIFAFQDNK